MQHEAFKFFVDYGYEATEEYLSLYKIRPVQRKKILKEQDVAVWDVMKTCYRKGSLDADIDETSILTNDFASFFTAHPSINHVFFNGGTAERIYKKYILTTLGDQFDYIQYDRLPSTSPAYASISLEEKAAAWELISDVLNR